MDKWKDIKIDDETMWPNTGLVKLDEAHKDDRGYIQSLVNFPMKNLSLISSKKGAVRSNHYHITDWHYMYIVYGAVDYYYRKHGSDEQPKLEKCIANDLVFTPPMEDHACIFTQDTLLVVASRNPRDQETYESDVVRIQLIDPEETNA